MSKPRSGDMCQVTHSHSGYTQGVVYEIVNVDENDDTVTLRLPGESEDGFWIKWSALLPRSTVSYETLKESLSSEVRAFLSAFEGLKGLRLREDCQAEIINEIPDLNLVLIRTVRRLDAQRFQSMSLHTLNDEGVELTIQGDYDEAIARLSVCLKREPKDKPIQANLAWALLLKGDDVARAHELFQSSQEKIKVDGLAWRSAWRRLGLLLSELSLSDADEARQEARAKLTEAYEALCQDAPSDRKRQAQERIALVSGRLSPLTPSGA